MHAVTMTLILLLATQKVVREALAATSA